jgi:hypothetical protein
MAVIETVRLSKGKDSVVVNANGDVEKEYRKRGYRKARPEKVAEEKEIEVVEKSTKNTFV